MSTKNFIISTPTRDNAQFFTEENRGASPITRSRLKSISQCATPRKSRCPTPKRSSPKKSRCATPNRSVYSRSRTGTRTPKRMYKELIKDTESRRFTLAEDFLIVKALKNGGGRQSHKQIAQMLMEVVERPREAIQGRIKQVFGRMDAMDLGRVELAAKKSPDAIGQYALDDFDAVFLQKISRVGGLLSDVRTTKKKSVCNGMLNLCKRVLRSLTTDTHQIEDD